MLIIPVTVVAGRRYVPTQCMIQAVRKGYRYPLTMHTFSPSLIEIEVSRIHQSYLDNIACAENDAISLISDRVSLKYTIHYASR